MSLTIEVLGRWTSGVLESLEVEEDETDVIPLVVGYLTSWFEVDGSWTGRHVDIAKSCELSEQDVQLVLKWLEQRGHLVADARGGAGWMYTPSTMLRLDNGPLAGMFVMVELTAPQRVMVAGSAIYEHDEERPVMQFCWPLLHVILLREGPLDGVSKTAHEVDPTWAHVELSGHEDEGFYRRLSDGHLTWNPIIDGDALELEIQTFLLEEQNHA